MKTKIRDQMLQLRQQLSSNERVVMNHKIIQTIHQHTAYQKAQNIALYYATQYEVDLQELAQSAQKEQKLIIYPIITTQKTLEFIAINKDTIFHPNRFGILEPQITNHEKISINKIDLMIVPMVAFDSFGNRLGMGCG